MEKRIEGNDRNLNDDEINAKLMAIADAGGSKSGKSV